jgi:hypothetical protein
MADNLTTDCPEVLVASTSWIPQGLPRSAQGLLYLYNKQACYTIVTCSKPTAAPQNASNGEDPAGYAGLSTNFVTRGPSTILYCPMVTRSLTVIKRPGRAIDHTPPSSSELKEG